MGDDQPSEAGASRSDPADEAMDRAIKDLQRWRLLRLTVLVVASGLGTGGLYAVRATGVDRYGWGSALAFAGAVLGAAASLARWREIGQPGAPRMRHHPWLLLAGALVLAGVFIGPHSLR